MPETDSIYVAADTTEVRSRRFSRPLTLVCILLLAILLLALLPPLVNVNRFQRRIVTSISASLGRPVHLDNVSMSLLPFPGFTLENLVVEEDPAFGSEPVISAGSVQATLRISSLWRKRVEFSSISFTNPSVNLVHMPDGKWNLESILIQAAHVSAAPTTQQKAGPAPRFPYIEATGARVNLKWGKQKTPFSLTDADFALWLANPQEWRIRLEAHPIRTDTNVSDTGTVRLEGTLGRAKSLKDVPLHLQADWRAAPLGEASRLFLGRDAGLRGEGFLSANLDGTVGVTAIQTRLRLDSVRRAEFVPDRMIAVDLECQAKAAEAFHAFQDVRCSWPPAGDSDKGSIALTASLPNIRKPDSLEVEIGAQALPNQKVIDWLQATSPRVPADLLAQGTLAGRFTYQPESSDQGWDGKLVMTGLSLKSSRAGLQPLTIGELALQSGHQQPDSLQSGGLQLTSLQINSRHSKPTPSTHSFLLEPTSLDLGGEDPATLDGSFDRTGYTLHLTGMIVLSRLTALGNTIPQLGDGLKEVLPTNRAAGPVRLDLTANRPWGGPQIWQDNTLHPAPIHPRHRTR